MANAIRDENHVPAALAVLNTDTVQGQNLVRVVIETDNLKVDSSATISFTMVPVDPQDENYVGVLLFEGTDGNLYPAVATSDGALLIDV